MLESHLSDFKKVIACLLIHLCSIASLVSRYLFKKERFKAVKIVKLLFCTLSLVAHTKSDETVFEFDPFWKHVGFCLEN